MSQRITEKDGRFFWEVRKRYDQISACGMAMSRRHAQVAVATTEGSRAPASSATPSRVAVFPQRRSVWVGATAARGGPQTQSGEAGRQPVSSLGMAAPRSSRVSSRTELEVGGSVARPSLS